MTQKAAERIQWAVTTLNVAPDEDILEIGCGHGVAVSLVATQLTTGTITAIDRSPKMIAAATQRNQMYIDAGKARLLCTTLEAAALNDVRFDKIFAIRVNFFIQQPAAQLPKLKALLKPGGALYLFYDPPRATDVGPFIDLATENLIAHGFVVQQVIEQELGALRGACVVAEAQMRAKLRRS